MAISLFRYRYRDAGNFKVHGSIVLEGALSEEQLEAVRGTLGGDGFFIAEQLGIPPLYEQLYRWSNGPIEADHCWHEFVSIEVVNESEVPPEAERWGRAEELLQRLQSIDGWQEELSPHFARNPRLGNILPQEANRG